MHAVSLGPPNCEHSSSKDSSESSEEMESFGTLTHGALQSDDGLHEYAAEALFSAEASNSMDVG